MFTKFSSQVFNSVQIAERTSEQFLQLGFSVAIVELPDGRAELSIFKA